MTCQQKLRRKLRTLSHDANRTRSSTTRSNFPAHVLQRHADSEISEDPTASHAVPRCGVLLARGSIDNSDADARHSVIGPLLAKHNAAVCRYFRCRKRTTSDEAGRAKRNRDAWIQPLVCLLYRHVARRFSTECAQNQDIRYRGTRKAFCQRDRPGQSASHRRDDKSTFAEENRFSD
jgi:hypothetical protein